jgi:hypothetical protein
MPPSAPELSTPPAPGLQVEVRVKTPRPLFTSLPVGNQIIRVILLVIAPSLMALTFWMVFIRCPLYSTSRSQILRSKMLMVSQDRFYGSRYCGWPFVEVQLYADAPPVGGWYELRGERYTLAIALDFILWSLPISVCALLFRHYGQRR